MKMNDTGKDELARILRAAHMRITPLRLSVLDVLLKKQRPMSHTEMQEALPQADRVTLYRTLAAFVTADIAHEVQGTGGTWHFCAHLKQSSGCPGGHPHFLCTSCDKMTCLLDQTLPRINTPQGCVVEGKQLVAYGLCPSCAENHQQNTSDGRDDVSEDH